MKIVDFSDLQAKRDGVLTPKYILENVLANVDNIKNVVVIIRQNDGQVVHGTSDMNSSEAIGMCEVGKVLIINDMWEDGV